MCATLCLCSMAVLATNSTVTGTAGEFNDKGHSINYVFVLDVSGSMVGKGQGNPAVIFPQVKDVMHRYIDQIEVGSNLFIFPFDSTVHDTFCVYGIGLDRTALHKFVDTLEALGTRTFIYESLRSVFLRLRSYIQSRSSQTDFTNIVYLLTDGNDNSPSKMSLHDALNDFQLAYDGAQWKRADDWLYYITLDVDLKDSDKTTLQKTPGVIHMPNARGRVSMPLVVIPKLRQLTFSNFRSDKQPSAKEGFYLRGDSVAPEIGAHLALDGTESMPFTFELTKKTFRADSLVNIELVPFPDENISFDHLTGSIEFYPVTKDRPITITPSRIPFVLPNCRAEIVSRLNQQSLCGDTMWLDDIDLRTSGDTICYFPLELLLDSQSCVFNEDVEVNTSLERDDDDTSFYATVADVGGGAVARIPTEKIRSSSPYVRNLAIKWVPGAPEGVVISKVELRSRSYEINGPIQYVGVRFKRSASLLHKILLALLIGVSLFFVTLFATSLSLGANLRDAYAFWLYSLRLRVPRLAGRLEYQLSDGERVSTLDLQGSHSLNIGPGSDHMEDLAAAVEVVAKNKRGKSAPYLRLKSGELTRSRSGKGQEWLRPGKTVEIALDDVFITARGEKVIYKR